MTQNQAIAKHLERGKTLTQAQAARLFNCWRLSGRIHDLRRQGYNILTENITTKHDGAVKTFARYSLR